MFRNDMIGKSHLPGLDLLRVVAAVLIFVQHLFSVTGHDDINVEMNARLGRLGTALLFTMSGFLAASTTRTPEQWLWQRLVRLYPAFWIVLAASFVGASITGRKDFDTLQVVCEFAGIGFFTHSIVLITVWFFSLILLMTMVIYLAHRLGHAPVIGGAVIAIAAGAHLVDAKTSEYFGFAMVYLLGYALGAPGNTAGRWMLPAVALGALVMFDLPGYRNLLCAIVLLALAVRENWPTWGPATRFPPFAYEWFLSHGLCLQLVCLATKNIWIVLPVAAMLSVLGAIALRWIVAKIISMAGRIYSQPFEGSIEQHEKPTKIAKFASSGLNGSP
jgi:hypothetical protein